MNIIIVGCGKVGETLAYQLNKEGNNVTIVDDNAEKVRSIANKLDIMGVIGNGASRTTQMEAGIDSADLIIAVTGTDEINLLCCLVAKKSAGCRTIARIKNPAYNVDASYFKNELGLAMVINPELAAAKEIARILNFPSVIKAESFARGRLELLTFKIPENSKLIGLSVREAVTKFRCNFIFGTVERDGEAFIANGNFVFAEKDVVSIISTSKDALDFFSNIASKIQPIKDVTVAGSDEITYYLCKLLNRSGIAVKIIEKDPDKCNEFAIEFPRVTVINGNPADEDTLREEGIDRASAFVALTELDEENVLLSLFAKKMGVRKSITKIKRIDYNDIISHLDLDSIVYPKNITADSILSYVRAVNNSRGSNLETLYKILDGEAEAAEFIIGEGSPITGKPLSDLSLKDDVIIAAIHRGATQITPRGQTVVEPGDSVIVVTKGVQLADISDILK